MKKSLAKLIDLAADNHNSKCELNEGNVLDRYQTVGAERASLVSRNENEESEIKRLILPQCDNEEQDGDYYILRQAVKEYRATMNEYYMAATEAFSNGDHARSITLLEKGKFFYRKAREADEESAKRIFSSRLGSNDNFLILSSECRYFMSIGNCKYGSNCKYHHPKERITQPSINSLGPHGLPLRLGEAMCSYFSMYGVCIYGPMCKFDHPIAGYVSSYGFNQQQSSLSTHL